VPLDRGIIAAFLVTGYRIVCSGSIAVLTVLLYGAESWGPTAQQMRRLEVFHQRRLHGMLRIRCWEHITNEEVLARAGVPSIALLLLRLRLTWLGHVGRMGEERLVKRLLFGQQGGMRQRGRPHASLRRTFEHDVCTLHGGQPNGQAWYEQCHERKQWRYLVQAVDLTA